MCQGICVKIHFFFVSFFTRLPCARKNNLCSGSLLDLNPMFMLCVRICIPNQKSIDRQLFFEKFSKFDFPPFLGQL